MGRRLVRWKAVVILLVVLGIIFYVVMAQSRQRLDALSTRNEQLQQQYAALDQKNRDLREELTYVATDAYIEETARNASAMSATAKSTSTCQHGCAAGLHRGGMERAAG